MNDSQSGTEAEESQQRSGDAETGTTDRMSELESANAELRERVAELESIVAEIAPGSRPANRGEAEPSGNEERTDGASKPVLPSGGQAHKVMGKFADPNAGVGVYGHNTADSGTTYGVWGEVNSSDGYGLYTPNDVRIEGKITAPSDVDLDPDDEDEFREVFLGENAAVFYNPFYSIDGNSNQSLMGIKNVDALYLPSQIPIAFTEFGSGAGTIQRTAGPVAKAWIDKDATIKNGVNVSSVTWKNTYYEITLSDDEYWYNEYATTVTSGSSPDVIWSTNSNNGNLWVSPDDNNKHDFQFVTHKLISGQATSSSATTEPDSETAVESTGGSSGGSSGSEPSTRS